MSDRNVHRGYNSSEGIPGGDERQPYVYTHNAGVGDTNEGREHTEDAPSARPAGDDGGLEPTERLTIPRIPQLRDAPLSQHQQGPSTFGPQADSLQTPPPPMPNPQQYLISANQPWDLQQRPSSQRISHPPTDRIQEEHRVSERYNYGQSHPPGNTYLLPLPSSGPQPMADPAGRPGVSYHPDYERGMFRGTYGDSRISYGPVYYPPPRQPVYASPYYDASTMHAYPPLSGHASSAGQFGTGRPPMPQQGALPPGLPAVSAHPSSSIPARTHRRHRRETSRTSNASRMSLSASERDFPSLRGRLVLHRDSPGQQPRADWSGRMTILAWEEQSTLCIQVEVNGIEISRRCDNNMINGTKLLNYAGYSRGRRDGILKHEQVRHVVKVGTMNLKGVWIPFERALELTQRESRMIDELYPLFVGDLESLLYHPRNLTRTMQVVRAAEANNPDFVGWRKHIQYKQRPDLESDSEESESDPQEDYYYR